MSDKIQDRINSYLEDTIAAERNFEQALSSFGKAGVQTEVQTMLSGFSAKAKTQHERLTALLQRRGGSPSAGKTLLAEMLSFSTLTAQIGQSAPEKNTQHLMMTFAAAAAEMGMYEALLGAATVAGDQEVAALATQLHREEHDDYDSIWSILRSSATAAFQAEVADGRTPEEIIATYVQNATAAELSFESQLNANAKAEEDPVAKEIFQQHAEETHSQYERLEHRLAKLGKTSSILKGFVAQVFNFVPRIAQIGHEADERTTQSLILANAVENAEIAMYEALIASAELAGDHDTAQLARDIQQQERDTAQKTWSQIRPSAEASMAKLVAQHRP